MKYDIKINQRVVIENSWNLKANHMAVYQVITEFMNSKNCSKIIDENGTWSWVSHKLIIEDLPMFDIKERRCSDLIKDLCEYDLLELNPNNKTLGRTYLRVGINYDLLNSDYAKNNTPTQKIAYPYAKNCVPPTQKIADYNNTNISNTNNKFFIFNDRIKIFQNDLRERFEYEKGLYIFFLDNSRVLDGKIIVPQDFLIDFLNDIHPIRFEGILKLFEGNIEQRKKQFLTVAEKLFKERCSSTFDDIDHFINTVRKIHFDIEKSKAYKKPYVKQEKLTFVKGQDNSEGW